MRKKDFCSEYDSRMKGGISDRRQYSADGNKAVRDAYHQLHHWYGAGSGQCQFRLDVHDLCLLPCCVNQGIYHVSV